MTAYLKPDIIELPHVEKRDNICDKFVVDWDCMQDFLILRFASKTDDPKKLVSFAEWDTQDANVKDVAADLDAIIDALKRIKSAISGESAT